MNKFAISLLVAAFSAQAQETPGAWVPKVEFALEDSNYRETMTWISGWAYALTELGKASVPAGTNAFICLPPHGHVESRVLLDILNKRFKGTRITSEKASEALWVGAISNYRCGK